MTPAFHWKLAPHETARSRNAGPVSSAREDEHSIRILAISGSLRQASTNSALVNVAAALPLASVEIVVYAGLAALPPFNPTTTVTPRPKPSVDSGSTCSPAMPY